jgi:hypothetical protein
MTRLEWIQSALDNGFLFDFESHLKKLSQKGQEFFEFEGIKIKSDSFCNFDYDENSGNFKYRRYKCETHPFQDYQEKTLYLTDELYYDSWGGKWEHESWYFEYGEEIKVIKFIYCPK